MPVSAFDHEFDKARRAADLRRNGGIVPPTFDPWAAEIAVAEVAIAVLWAQVRATRDRDFRLEQFCGRATAGSSGT